MAQRAQQALAGLMCAMQLLLCPLTADLALPAPAQAVLKSPNAQIPRSVDAALRRCVSLRAWLLLVLSGLSLSGCCLLACLLIMWGFRQGMRGCNCLSLPGTAGAVPCPQPTLGTQAMQVI